MSSTEELERWVLARLTAQGHSLPFRELQAATPDRQQLAPALRSLMEARKIQLHQPEGAAEKYVSLVTNLSETLALVLHVVRESGREGIDAAAIGSKARLAKVEVTKALTHLCAQQRVKDIRCYTNKARKHYLLFDLEPAESVTGGHFYTDARDIDFATIDALRRRLTAVVVERRVVSAAQLRQALAAAPGGPEVAAAVRGWTAKELGVVLHSLVLDGILERADGTAAATATAGAAAADIHGDEGACGDGELFQLAPGGGGGVLRHAQPHARFAAATLFPCVGCPLLERCSAVGAVSPQTCTYLNDWLRAA